MLIISYKASEVFKKFLQANDFSFIETIPNPNLDKRIDDHPDLSLFKLTDDTIIVDEGVYDYYKDKLGGYNIIKGEKVGEKYPRDSIYNIIRIKNYYIHNDITERNIENYLSEKRVNHLKVKQGYTRCSIIPLKNILITSDYGIYKALREKIAIKLVDYDEVSLDGFAQGFLGGTCGLVGNKLIFTGDITRHRAYPVIKEVCDRENIDIIYPETQLVDLGSIIEI